MQYMIGDYMKSTVDDHVMNLHKFIWEYHFYWYCSSSNFDTVPSIISNFKLLKKLSRNDEIILSLCMKLWHHQQQVRCRIQLDHNISEMWFTDQFCCFENWWCYFDMAIFKKVMPLLIPLTWDPFEGHARKYISQVMISTFVVNWINLDYLVT